MTKHVDRPRPRKKNKYNARKVKCDGHVFDSHAEYTRYSELLLLQRAGEISGLEVHPVFDLVLNGCKLASGRYKADFRYMVGDQEVVEDVKGFCTKDFPLKRDVVANLYPSIVFVIKWYNKKSGWTTETVQRRPAK